MFFIGQKVQCIDPTWGTATGHPLQISHCPNLPVKDGIYHIRTCEPPLGPNMALNIMAGCWVRLLEVVNPIVAPHEYEPIFMGSKYRPVYDNEYKNEHVTKIIQKLTGKVDA